MGMDKKFIKVIKVLVKAGITPNELGYVIFADMYEMLCELERKNLPLSALLEEAKRKVDDDELVARITNLKAKE
jgi:hypothetical protein